jgi:RNA recognition motif-containing protein
MGHRILIEDLDGSVTEEALRALVAKYGTVVAIELVRDGSAAEGTQVAFVDLENAKGWHAAVAGLEGQTVAGRPLKVKGLKEHGATASGPASVGAFGAKLAARGGRFGVVSGRGAKYGQQGRGKSGGRNP